MPTIHRSYNTRIYAILATAIVFFIDVITPLGYAVGLLYVLCFLLVYQENRKTIIFFATLISLLILSKFAFFYGTKTDITIDYWMVLVNRSLSVFTVFVAAILALRHQKLIERSFSDKEKQTRFVIENFPGDVAVHDLLYDPESLDKNNSRLILFGFSINQIYAALGLICVFVFDMFIPLGIAAGSLYVVCFLFVFQESRKTIISFALITIAFIFIKVMLANNFNLSGIPSGNVVLSNRLISVIVVVITAVFAIRHRTLLDEVNTQRELYIKLLEEANSKLEAMHQSIDTYLMFLITDPDGSIIYANKKFCDASGYSEQELIGQKPSIIKSGHHTNDFYHQFWQTIIAGKMWKGELKNKSKNGNYYWVDSTVLPVKDKTGKVTQFLAMHSSIDERKKLEEKILKNHQELEEFAFIATHDLKSPIVNINSLINLIEESHEIDGKSKMFIDKIKLSARQMENTIARLNEVVEHKDKISSSLQILSLQEILRNAIESISEIVQSSGAIISSDFSKAPELVFSPTELNSIFQNLLTNAIKFSKPDENPFINITSYITDNFTVLEIKDHGVGIDLSLYKDKLFGLFKRFHKNTEGKGIGLYIVKSIIDQHGGSIEVESKVNEGTLFKIYIINKTIK